jgi:ribosome-binding protein aMBF1 (putative translation factor)
VNDTTSTLIKKDGDKMSNQKMQTLDDLVRTLDANTEYRKQYRLNRLIHDVANGIYCRRKELGLTQAELANRLGTKQNAIARIESAENNIRINTLAEIAEALDARVTIELGPRFKEADYKEVKRPGHRLRRRRRL